MTTDERRRLLEGARNRTTGPTDAEVHGRQHTANAAYEAAVTARLQLIAVEKQVLGLTDEAFFALCKEHCGTTRLNGPQVDPAALDALYRALRAQHE